jgi:hypothetical protein
MSGAEFEVVWDGPEGETALLKPSSSDVAALLRSLDGASRTLVTVYRGESHFACGGSAASGVVAYLQSEDGAYFQLLGDSGCGDREVLVVAGGQPGWYRSDHVIPVDVAVEATEVFLSGGSVASSFSCEES